eukprot:722208-Pelagomonas_calceolata.AAC.1
MGSVEVAQTDPRQPTANPSAQKEVVLGGCSAYWTVPATQRKSMTSDIKQCHRLQWGGDLQPGRFTGRLVAGLSQPEINPQSWTQKRKV